MKPLNEVRDEESLNAAGRFYVRSIARIDVTVGDLQGPYKEGWEACFEEIIKRLESGEADERFYDIEKGRTWRNAAQWLREMKE